jgi:hypothetical protein
MAPVRDRRRARADARVRDGDGPGDQLIAPITDRMPAILEDADWATWLGETAASPAEVKATLRTMEGVNWKW